MLEIKSFVFLFIHILNEKYTFIFGCWMLADWQRDPEVKFQQLILKWCENHLRLRLVCRWLARIVVVAVAEVNLC